MQTVRQHGLGLVLGVLLGASLGAAPVLVLEPETYSWGRQTENKGAYPFSFTVKNTGDEALVISKVRPGCSCTEVTLKKDALAPGEATEMTGVLTTKGTEGGMRKGIILSTNDPNRPTAIATLDIRFPIPGEGLRLRGTTVYCTLRDDAIRAYLVVENCEEGTPLQVQAMELPEGWDCAQTLPVAIQPEERVTLTLSCPVAGGATVEPFEDLPFTLITDSPKTPRLQGTLLYRPPRAATSRVPAPAVGGASAAPAPAAVRWPLAPVGVSPIAPATTPVPLPAGVPVPTVKPTGAGVAAP